MAHGHRKQKLAVLLRVRSRSAVFISFLQPPTAKVTLYIILFPFIFPSVMEYPWTLSACFLFTICNRKKHSFQMTVLLNEFFKAKFADNIYARFI